MPRKIFAIALFCTLAFVAAKAQPDASDINPDAFKIKEIHNTALNGGKAYDWLAHLTQRIGARLSGSPQAAAAVEFTRQMLDSLGLDTVWLQPCMVPQWVRGEQEEVRIVNSNKIGTQALRALALGGSIGTSKSGITAQVLEVSSVKQAEDLGKAGKLKGKIVFFNRPFDETQINTFAAYGGAVDQRGIGPSKASRYGAVAAVVRSMTNKLDGTPHTGGTFFEDGVKPIPAVAISTLDAELLSQLLREEPVQVHIRTSCQILAPQLSYNVIGEIKGSQFPNEIILVGGHLDSWDVGQGAHDDGAGCVQSMDVLYVLKKMAYRPKRTIRCVLFMNEENGSKGAEAYAKQSNERGEFHLAAIESDRGGFTPLGFTCEGHTDIFEEKFKQIGKWSNLLEPYHLSIRKGGSGADIASLKSQKGLLIGYEPDSQRYFDYHHAPSDTFDAVNKRELQLGTAAMTSLVYLLDKYGLK